MHIVFIGDITATFFDVMTCAPVVDPHKVGPGMHSMCSRIRKWRTAMTSWWLKAISCAPKRPKVSVCEVRLGVEHDHLGHIEGSSASVSSKKGRSGLKQGLEEQFRGGSTPVFVF